MYSGVAQLPWGHIVLRRRRVSRAEWRVRDVVVVVVVDICSNTAIQQVLYHRITSMIHKKMLY